MIKWITDVLEVAKWAISHLINGPSIHPMMLPGNRALEVAEQRQFSRQERDIARMIKNLPASSKEGQKITLVGQGFVIDVIVRQGRWHFDG
jgi:hypothetical protein